MLKITTPCSSLDNKLKRLHYYCLDSGITYDHCPVTRHIHKYLGFHRFLISPDS